MITDKGTPYPKEWRVHEAKLYGDNGGTCEDCGTRGHIKNRLTVYVVKKPYNKLKRGDMICLCMRCRFKKDEKGTQAGRVDPRQSDMFLKVG